VSVAARQNVIHHLRVDEQLERVEDNVELQSVWETGLFRENVATWLACWRRTATFPRDRATARPHYVVAVTVVVSSRCRRRRHVTVDDITISITSGNSSSNSRYIVVNGVVRVTVTDVAACFV